MPAAGLHDLLLDPRPGQRGEGLALAPGDHVALADRHARDAGHARIGLHENGELVVEADGEGILLERRAVGIGHRLGLVELDRSAAGDAGGRSDLERLAGDPLGLVRSRFALELKPHAPSTRTRTPKPALEFEVAASSAPFLTVSPSVSRSTTRMSA